MHRHIARERHTHWAKRRLLFLYCGNQWEHSIAQFNAHTIPTNLDARARTQTHTHTCRWLLQGRWGGLWLHVGMWAGDILLPPSGDSRLWGDVFVLSHAIRHARFALFGNNRSPPPHFLQHSSWLSSSPPFYSTPQLLSFSALSPAECIL